MTLGTILSSGLDDAEVKGFKAGLRGELLRSGDDGYDTARKIFNAIFDKRPDLIVRCAGAGEVINAVKFAHSHKLSVAVRGGGHSAAGKSVIDGGMLIDLSPMKGIRVDPVKQTATA